MKNMKTLAIVAVLSLAVSGAAAQSLGDYAREARKNKPDPNATSHHYDNDNLPTDENVSVVGPAPSSDANVGTVKAAAASTAPADAASAADRQKIADDWKEKLDRQKQKIDSLNHEIDLGQRELRLRAVALNADAGARLRNAVQWDKDDERFRGEVDEKQKALESAQKELDDMQQQARKAGVVDKEKDNDTEKSK